MKKVLKITGISLLIAGLAIYLLGIFIFSKYTFPNTYVNGKDLSFIKIDEIDKKYEAMIKGHSVRLSGREGIEDTFKSKDFAYKETLKEPIKLKQSPSSWPVYLFQSNSVHAKTKVDFDQKLLEERVTKSPFMTSPKIKDGQEARIGYDLEKGYVILDEVEGSRVTKSKLKDVILTAFKNENKEASLEDYKAYPDPGLKKDSPLLINKVADLNKLNSIVISYNFDDRKEELKGEALNNLYNQDEEGHLHPDMDLIKGYIQNLAQKYDTFKGTRSFTATGGQVVSVSGGIYGWQTDQEKSAQALYDQLMKGESAELTPVYSMTALSRKANDLGPNYVEIDLSRQHMWVYKDGQVVVDTPVVTGNVSQGHGTPTGTHKVWSKERNRYLTGDNYRSFVRYWMPVNWTGVGIHDSSWRGSYGGNIYRGHGSHGCINTPPGQMPKVYENVADGTPVVIYRSWESPGNWTFYLIGNEVRSCLDWRKKWKKKKMPY